MRIPGLRAQGDGNNLPVRNVPKMTGAKREDKDGE